MARATVQELSQALKRADEQGNTEDARRLANTLRMVQRGPERQTGQDIPEIGSMTDFGESAPPGASPRIGLGMFTTPDPESRKDIIREAIPGTEFTEDEEGNTVIELPDGRQAYMNKPGFSQQDFADFASDVVKFLPSARFAAGGKSLLGIGTRAFAGGAATSVGEDVAAIPQGSEQGIQPRKAAVTGAVDIAGEGAGRALSATGRALAPVFRRAFGRRTGDIMDNGQLSQSARRAVERAGMDPDAVTPEMAREAVRAVRQGVPDENVAGVAAARRFDVPLTRGEQTGDFQQLAREEDLAGRTDEAGEIVRQGRQRRSRRAAEAAGEVEETLGGGQPPLRTDAEGGARIRGNVQPEAERLMGDIDTAFENARGRNASLTREGLDRMSNAAETLREDPDILVDEELTPATVRALNEIDGLAGGGSTGKTIQQIETTRRRINQLQDAAKNNTDRRGVTKVKRQFDAYLDDAFDNALFSGDQEALDALKNARQLRAEYGRRFQEGGGRNRSGRRIADPGGKAVQSIVENNPTDEQVVNMVFGRSRVFNPDNAAKTIDALREAAGDREALDRTLKQLTFRRITKDAVEDGQFRPQKFVTAYNRIKKENPTVFNKVFSENERRALDEFRDIAQRQIKPEGVVNNSKTAQTLMRLTGRAGSVLGWINSPPGFQFQGSNIGRTAGGGVGGIIERSSARGAARDAINPQFLLSGRPNAALISSSIAAARNEEGQNQAREAIDRTRGRAGSGQR